MTRLVLSLCGRPGCSDVGVDRTGRALVAGIGKSKVYFQSKSKSTVKSPTFTLLYFHEDDLGLTFTFLLFSRTAVSYFYFFTFLKMTGVLLLLSYFDLDPILTLLTFL